MRRNCHRCRVHYRKRSHRAGSGQRKGLETKKFKTSCLGAGGLTFLAGFAFRLLAARFSFAAAGLAFFAALLALALSILAAALSFFAAGFFFAATGLFGFALMAIFVSGLRAGLSGWIVARLRLAGLPFAWLPFANGNTCDLTAGDHKAIRSQGCGRNRCAVLKDKGDRFGFRTCHKGGYLRGIVTTGYRCGENDGDSGAHGNNSFHNLYFIGFPDSKITFFGKNEYL